MDSVKTSRRNFLKTAAVGAGLLLGWQVVRKVSATEPQGTSPHSWAMVIDMNKCTGCGHCTLACRAVNDINPNISWTRVIDAGQVGDRKVFLPRPCMHCGHAPCVEVCPVKASYHRPDGIVMMDYDRCIGCRYCEVACPYGGRAIVK
jgi:Fe-S-cluster-containing dehydrogenase component